MKQLSDSENVKYPAKSDTIYLNKVDRTFLPYMPDTNMIFKSSKELKDYSFMTMKRFDSFKTTVYSLKKVDTVFEILSLDNASIYFDDLMQVNYFNFYKRAPKDNLNMGALAMYSPSSNIISLKDKLSFYYSFPEELQKNEFGEKTFKRLNEYAFDKNINKSFRKFDHLELQNFTGKKVFLQNIFDQKYGYYIITLGASWCLPCRRKEAILKYWLPFIDTSKVSITGLSIDKSFSKWVKYLGEDKLPWHNYLLKNDMNNELVKALQFESVPRNFLLDSKGNILAENTDIRKVLKEIPIIKTNDQY